MALSKYRENPPIYTVLCEIVGWSLDRTADFPKSQRFTFGQRLDNLILDALQLAVKAIRTRQRSQKVASLHELDLVLEQLRVLWRLVNERGWISRQQLVFAQDKLDETGRMVGGWLGQLETGAQHP
jgi:hypothetical protein